MALPSSGQISLSQIQTEFGGSNPIGMNEYYRGGSYTTSNNTNVPTSGQISMSNFYGAIARVTVNVTYNTQADTYLWDSRGGSYIAGITTINVTINSGQYLYASSTGSYGFYIHGFTSGDIINIYNYGTICGKGGEGGFGAYGQGYGAGGGASGGHGLYVAAISATVNMWNYGNIAGGGGGGGGGGCAWISGWEQGGGGGGGGAGYSSGAGGGSPHWVGWNYDGKNYGSGGGVSSGGAGGAGSDRYTGTSSGGGKSPSYGTYAHGGAGGAGGGWGAGGGSGEAAYWYTSPPGYPPAYSALSAAAGGGGAGYYVIGNNRISWQATGNLYGPAGNT